MVIAMIAPYLVCFSVLGSIFHQYMYDMSDPSLIANLKIRANAQGCSGWLWRQDWYVKLYSALIWLSFQILKFFYLLWMSPISIIYFVIIDIIFMIYTFISIVIWFVWCSFHSVHDLHIIEQKIDNVTNKIFKALFQMNKAQTIGYRRMRTLSQVSSHFGVFSLLCDLFVICLCFVRVFCFFWCNVIVVI